MQLSVTKDNIKCLCQSRKRSSMAKEKYFPEKCIGSKHKFSKYNYPATVCWYVNFFAEKIELT